MFKLCFSDKKKILVGFKSFSVFKTYYDNFNYILSPWSFGGLPYNLCCYVNINIVQVYWEFPRIHGLSADFDETCRIV